MAKKARAAKKRTRAARKLTNARLSGVSFKQVEDSISDLERKIRSLSVTRGEHDEKDAILRFLAALKELLRSLCMNKLGRFIPFFLGQ
jgi:hypothetical protein